MSLLQLLNILKWKITRLLLPVSEGVAVGIQEDRHDVCYQSTEERRYHSSG